MGPIDPRPAAVAPRKRVRPTVLLFGALAGVLLASVAFVLPSALPLLVREYWEGLRVRRALPPPRVAKPGDGGTRFVDVAEAAGIRYRFRIEGTRPMDILQTIGNGCAFLDYDNDGNLDVLLVGRRLALYRGDGRGGFRDVTAACGLSALSARFLGCAVGDYDNDGFVDVYVSGYRAGVLLRNRRGKGFADVTRQAGLAPQPWGTSCAWGDYDTDGRLDLFIANYLDFDPNLNERLCSATGGIQIGCPPRIFSAERGVLYRNRGGGQFQDVTRAAGLAGSEGKTLGAAWADHDGSGRPSLYLANDMVPADLFNPSEGSRFENHGMRSGAAVTDGRPHAGMGADWGDYDNDGRPDLAVATFVDERKPVFRNLGGSQFADLSQSLGVDRATRMFVGFGAKWLDYDNDGWLDLLFTNGHVYDNVEAHRPDQTFRQPTVLLQNDRGERFVDRSLEAGPALMRPIVGRGLAVGDFDNDGRVDALAVDGEGAPLLLQNRSGRAGRWLSIRLVGMRSNRDGIGARVEVVAGGLRQTRVCHTDGSYLSASDKRVHVGVGRARVADTVVVHWPGGHRDVFRDLPTNRNLVLREGSSRG